MRGVSVAFGPRGYSAASVASVCVSSLSAVSAASGSSGVWVWIDMATPLSLGGSYTVDTPDGGRAYLLATAEAMTAAPVCPQPVPNCKNGTPRQVLDHPSMS